MLRLLKLAISSEVPSANSILSIILVKKFAELPYDWFLRII